MNNEIINKDLVILKTRPYEIDYLGGAINSTGDDEFTGSNPNQTVEIVYYLKKRHLFGEMKIELFDKNGELLKELIAGKRKRNQQGILAIIS